MQCETRLIKSRSVCVIYIGSSATTSVTLRPVIETKTSESKEHIKHATTQQAGLGNSTPPIHKSPYGALLHERRTYRKASKLAPSRLPSLAPLRDPCREHHLLYLWAPQHSSSESSTAGPPIRDVLPMPNSRPIAEKGLPLKR